jgi:hypothetical protein
VASGPVRGTPAGMTEDERWAFRHPGEVRPVQTPVETVVDPDATEDAAPTAAENEPEEAATG